ncbi:MAG: hypothetical protein DI535_04655 [Citrobacter freundii]|nr:MAG: hypothetical protein DI535_04655 [Citrobacter freundii]
MKNRFRRLFLFAVLASAGLLCLQIYWIVREWDRSEDILQREVDYSFQQAIDREWAVRKDTLASYLSYFLHDTNFVQFQTQLNKKDSTWMVRMIDAKNAKDYSSWSNPQLGLNGPMTPKQRDFVIDRFVEDNVRKSIASDVIFFYTQRFGKIWTDKYKALKLDTARVNKFFKEELIRNNVHNAFSIAYVDTSSKQLLPQKGNDFLQSKKLLVNYTQVNDFDKKYLAQATVDSPAIVLLKRMWLMISGSFLLLGFTFFALYKMYKTIIRQKQLDELKDDFISNMTHELKTPIATVTAAIDGLQYYDALEDKQRTKRYLDTSRKELQRLDELVSKVLELSVDQRMNGQLRKERFALKDFLEQLLSSFSLQSSLEWDLAIRDDVKVYGDKQQLLSVFQNLTENAIKYGNSNTKLNIEVSEEEDRLRIVFQDNGPGVDAAFLPHIFNKFYRVRMGELKVKGFGLGLFHVQTIITAHGGSIKAENNDGLTFIINLPLHD